MWTYNYAYSYADELYHYGVLGMKWGKRRYQNADGSLTKAGERRYNKVERKIEKKYSKAGKSSVKQTIIAARALKLPKSTMI